MRLNDQHPFRRWLQQADNNYQVIGYVLLLTAIAILTWITAVIFL